MKFLMNTAALALLTIAAPVAALTTIYTTAATTPGTQDYSGTLGLNFDVSSAVKVYQFGAFDSGKDGITTNITVAIFDRNTGLIVSPVVDFIGTANAGGTAYVFKSVTPFVLAAGNYQLGAWNYNPTDQNFNTMGANPGPIIFNSAGGALTALDAQYGLLGNEGTIANQADPGLTRYGAGTFVVGIPEPTTWSLLIAGFGLVGIGMRRRTAVTV